MLVRCTTTEIAPHIEKLTGHRRMVREDLVVGHEYAVWSVYVVPDSDLLRWHLAYLIELDPYLLAPIPSAFFELVDDRLPDEWALRFAETGVIAFEPLRFDEPDLVEKALDGDVSARMIIDSLR